MLVDGYKYIEVGSLQNDPILDVVHGVILHVTGSQVSPLEFFDGPSNGIESHFYIPRTRDLRKEQYRNTNREADANFRANSWTDVSGRRHGFLSVETQGLGGGSWTKYQIDEIKSLIRVLQKEHKFPYQKPRSAKGKGIGYHILFDSWSNVPGKICPGPDRIKQYNQIIIPWVEEQARLSKQQFHIATQSESVVSIAESFDTTVARLWRLNPDVNLPLKAGTKLRVR